MTKLFSAVVLLVGDHRHRPCVLLSLRVIDRVCSIGCRLIENEGSPGIDR